ncbi:hypothetical protein Taro_000169, partial [Colocasia esculenta]|nr:hypothetical protein [Colocasia esculenta]
IDLKISLALVLAALATTLLAEVLRTPKTHGCLNTLHPNPRDEFYNLLGSCGGALGGWRVGDQANQAHLLPRFVYYDLCKLSTWSRPKVIMTFKRKSQSRMGMRPSDERSKYESIYS